MGFPVMVVDEPPGSGIGSTNNGGASVQVRTLWSLPSRSKEGVIRHSFHRDWSRSKVPPRVHCAIPSRTILCN